MVIMLCVSASVVKWHVMTQRLFTAARKQRGRGRTQDEDMPHHQLSAARPYLLKLLAALKSRDLVFNTWNCGEHFIYRPKEHA